MSTNEQVYSQLQLHFSFDQKLGLVVTSWTYQPLWYYEYRVDGGEKEGEERVLVRKPKKLEKKLWTQF